MNLFYTGFDEGGAKRLAVSHSLDDAPSPDCFSRHCHDGYELLYVAQGEGRYVIEGEEYALQGIDTTPVVEGKTYKLVYTKG